MHEQNAYNEEGSGETRGIPQDCVCKQCGYALAGLDAGGVCPECGMAIERSLTDDRLIHSAPGYLARLHTGVVLILAGIITQLLTIFGGVGAAIAMAVAGVRTGRAPEIAMQVVSTAASFGIAYGWWLFSSPDPAFTGRFDGSTARRVVRVTTIINAGMAVVSAVMNFTAPPAALATPAGGPATGNMAIILYGVIGVVGVVAWGVSFFASMLYLRWLCPRIPNPRASGRAKTLMWLGPVLYIPGSCIVIGPLIALVLYWNMLNWIRRDLKRIRAEQVASA